MEFPDPGSYGPKRLTDWRRLGGRFSDESSDQYEEAGQEGEANDQGSDDRFPDQTAAEVTQPEADDGARCEQESEEDFVFSETTDPPEGDQGECCSRCEIPGQGSS